MKALYFLSILLFYWSSNAQIKKERQIVIVRTPSYNGCLLSPKLIINTKDTIRVKYKSFIVKNIESDSLIIEIPYVTGLFQKKKAYYSFFLKDPITYFVFNYNWFESKPSFKNVFGKNLEELKKKKYMKEFNLE